MKKNQHQLCMEKAYKQALVAYKKGEVPVGAVLIDAQGAIIARGHNQTERKKCQTAHAECAAIQQACRKRGDWRLDDTWLYVTLEPCVMCFGLIILSRVRGLVYGVASPLFGSKKALRPSFVKKRYGRPLTIVELDHQKSGALLKSFFVNKRTKKEV